MIKYPSVTEILDKTMPNEKRASLEAWRMRVGEENAAAIVKAAMERGNKIDEQVAVFQETGTCEDVRIAQYLDGFAFIEREYRIKSEAGKYRGRLDAILQMNDTNILVDFKGSTRWKPEKYLVDYRLQLGAYYGALLEMGHRIDKGCVVLFVDGRDRPQIYWQQKEQLEKSHAEFLMRVEQFYIENAVDPVF